MGTSRLSVDVVLECLSLLSPTIIDIQLQFVVRQTGVDHFRFCSLLVRSDAMTIAPRFLGPFVDFSGHLIPDRNA